MLTQHGAVSEPVARALAEGALTRSGADIAIGITGIAGPGGGSDQKPVGMVWIAVARREPRDTDATVCRFLGGREMVKTFAAVTAVDLGATPAHWRSLGHRLDLAALAPQLAFACACHRLELSRIVPNPVVGISELIAVPLK